MTAMKYSDAFAGDDTILIVLEDAEKASAYFEKINSLIK